MSNPVILNDQKIKTRLSCAEQVFVYVKDLILSGELRQGEKIAEEKIASKFGVSRTPIREALTRLQTYGLVNIKPWSYAEVLSIDCKDARDIAELRLRLELMIFQLLSDRCSEEVINNLNFYADSARNGLLIENKATYFESDSLFHNCAANHCGNGQLALMYNQFEAKVHLLRIAQDVPFERLEIYMRQHFDIIDLLKAGRYTAIEELLKIHIIHDL